MKLVTQVSPIRVEQKMSYNDNILLIGSCFADNIGKMLKDYRFNVMLNPFGTLYNPASIANSIELLKEGKDFTDEQVIEHNGLYCSFSHHGSFSKSNKEDFLSNANTQLAKSKDFFKSSTTIIITLGTAWIYKHIGKDIIVSNCHKISAKEFSRQLLSLKQTLEQLNKIIALLSNSSKPSKLNKIIFTVSPIRHMADGAHGNQISKSILLLALDELINNNPLPDKIELSYFPAYEIMMDELRDYRFYADDMTHPSELAIKYIFEIFSNSYLDSATQIKMIEEYKKTKREMHIPFHQAPKK